MRIKAIGLLCLSFISFAVLLGCGGGGGDSEVYCGGADGNPCLATQYCRFTDFSCGPTTVRGVCRDIPLDCNAPPTDPTFVTSTVCGCDNVDFFNECWAAQAGQSIRGAGQCP